MNDSRECPNCGGEVSDPRECECVDCLTRDAPYRPKQLLPDGNEIATASAPINTGGALTSQKARHTTN